MQLELSILITAGMLLREMIIAIILWYRIRLIELSTFFILAMVVARMEFYSKDTADIINNINDYFLSPMKTTDKLLAGFMIIFLVVLLSYITYKAIQNIWNDGKSDKDKKKLL